MPPPPPLCNFFLLLHLYLKVISVMRRPFHTIYVGVWSPPPLAGRPPTPPPPALKVAPKREGVGVWPIVPTPPGLGQFGSPNSKGVSKGCAWGLFGGNIV